MQFCRSPFGISQTNSNFDIEKGEDDFDRYFGFGAISDFGYPFAIMHYRGYPESTSTIYLPRDFGSDLKKITEAVHSIATELTHSDKLLLWERKDDPDL
jgi:hypothetical protein